RARHAAKAMGAAEVIEIPRSIEGVSIDSSRICRSIVSAVRVVRPAKSVVWYARRSAHEIVTNGRKCPADRIAYIDAHYGWLEYQLITRADANINRDGQRSCGDVARHVCRRGRKRNAFAAQTRLLPPIPEPGVRAEIHASKQPVGY